MSVDVWSRGCERLATVLPEQQFNTWIRPLSAAAFADHGDGAVATLRVPNRFMLDWIRTQYATRIETVLSEVAGKSVKLDLQLAARGVPQGTRPCCRRAPTSPFAPQWHCATATASPGQARHWQPPHSTRLSPFTDSIRH